MEKENFELILTAEYKDEMIRQAEKLLEEKLPDYTRYKALVIKLIDSY